MKRIGKGRLFVVSAPSGAGKTTVVKGALRRLHDIKMSVSWTTRKAKKGEKNGRDYTFVTKRRFEALIKARGFAEWAKVFDKYYGTPLSNIEDAKKKGLDLFLVIDVQGGAQIRKMVKGSKLIFILPPSMKDLEERLRKRKRETESEIKRRLKEARREIRRSKFYDNRIVNDRLPKAVSELVKIVRKTRISRLSQ